MESEFNKGLIIGILITIVIISFLILNNAGEFSGWLKSFN